MTLLFQPEPKLTHLGVPYSRVLALHQSRSDVQINIGGFESQTASAVVCLYSPQKGEWSLVVAFHLRVTDELVFYRYAGVVNGAMQEALQRATEFAESMGFLIDDTGFAKLPEERRKSLWLKLPIEKGTRRSQVLENSVGQAAIVEASEILVQKKKAFIQNLGRMLGSM